MVKFILLALAAIAAAAGIACCSPQPQPAWGAQPAVVYQLQLGDI